MCSRRSSDDYTSGGDDDGRSRDSISLEFDDYPLDLVSPIRRDYDDDQDLESLSEWRLPDQTCDFGEQKDPFLTSDTLKFVDEPDRLITDEIITDLGNRRSATYDTAEVDRANGDIFVTASNIHRLSSVYPVECNESPEEEHYERKGYCSAIGEWFRLVCKGCLAKYHKLPEKPTWSDRWRHALLCPPHGWLSHFASLILLVLIVWALLWTVDQRAAQTGGGLLALLLLTVASYVTGNVVTWIRLPALLGMFIAGCILRNVPAINVAANIDPHLANIIRETGMSLLLLRSGLVLTPLSVRQQCLTSLRLAVLVNCLDMVTMTVLSKYMLAIPWLWSVLLGFLTATVGPTVVNPCAFAFQSRGYGINKAIASLLVVASSVDNIIPVTGFAVLLVLLGDEGHLVLNIFRGPLEAMGGVLVAMVTGLILWYIPHPLHPSRTLLRVLLLLSCGCLFSLGSWALGLTSATPIGTITLMFVVIPRWRRERSLREKMKKSGVEYIFRRLWCIAQPLFYGIMGAQINVSSISVKLLGVSCALVLITCVIRLLVTFLILVKTPLNLKERLFVALAWLPKASVQQSMVVLAAQTLNHDKDPEELGELIKLVTTVGYLIVLISLPLGSALTMLTGSCLLSRSSHLLSTDPSEKTDLVWTNHNGYKPEVSRMKISDISTHTTEIEVTTERETVT